MWLKFYLSPGYSVTKNTQVQKWLLPLNVSLSQHNQLPQSPPHWSHVLHCKKKRKKHVFMLYLVYTLSKLQLSLVSCYSLLLSSWIVHYTIKAKTVGVPSPGWVTELCMEDWRHKIASKRFLNKVSFPHLHCVWLHYCLRQECKNWFQKSTFERGNPCQLSTSINTGEFYSLESNI